MRTAAPTLAEDSTSNTKEVHVTADTVSSQTALVVSLVTVFLSGLIFLVVIDAGEIVNLALKLILLAILTLTLKRWTGALVLVLLQANLFFLEEPQVAQIDPVTSVIWVAVSLLLIETISRYRTLQNFEPYSALRLLPQVSRLRDLPRTAEARRSADSLRKMISALAAVLLQLAGCALVASLLMWLVPLQGRSGTINTVQTYRILPGGYRAIMMGLLLFLLYLPTWLVTNEIRWRRHTARQSGLYLRGVFLKWLHRDLRMVVRRTIRQRKRRTVAVSGRGNHNSTTSDLRTKPTNRPEEF